MQEDTVVRFIGSYEIFEYEDSVISLPKNAKKIAKGAFFADNKDYHKKYVSWRYLTIPPNVVIEKGAFSHCGMLDIELEEGWTTIPEETFAYMVPMDEVEEKIRWVEVDLPESIKKVERKAFALGDGNKEDETELKNKLKELQEHINTKYYDDVLYLVSVDFGNEKWKKEVEIGTDAFFGCEVW